MLSLLYAAALLAPAQTAPAEIALVETAPAETVPAGHIAVVCPPELRDALRPWEDHRRAGRWQVSVVPPEADADATLAAVRRLSAPELPVTHVLLVGDCGGVGAASSVTAEATVPTHYRASRVTQQFGSTALFATDAPYGDLDGDGIPDAAVGRLPADSAAQLETLVRRMLAFETKGDFGQWRRRVHLIAGVGGFGALADAAIESGVRTIISSALPLGLRTTVTHASPTSPFFPGTRQFRQTVVDRLAEGGLAWVYIGHGHVTALDQIPSDPEGQPILSNEDLEAVLREYPSQVPIALMLACLTGAYDAGEDCLAERLVMAEGGPVAAIAGSRITLPYGNASLASAMVDAWFAGEKQTLGEVLLAAQQRCAQPSGSASAQEVVLSAMASLLSPTRGQLDEERAEHAMLYNLLGDPSMPLQHPIDLPLQFNSFAAPGEVLTIRGEAAHGGHLTVELAHPPGASSSDPAAANRYDQANQAAIVSVTREIAAGPFAIELPVPEAARGGMLVRAFLGAPAAFSLGGGNLTVVPPRKTPPTAAADRP